MILPKKTIIYRGIIFGEFGGIFIETASKAYVGR